MSQIKLSPKEYGNFVIIMLLEAMRNKDILDENEVFREFMTFIEGRGAKPQAMKGFLNSNSDTRMKFKRAKKVLETGKGDITIMVTDSEKDINEESDFDRDLCKQVFRTIKEYRFKHPSRILREDRIDKIIDYCIEQRKKQQEEQQNG